MLSGEHSSFSRLAIVVPGGTTWRFGRSGDGYELRLDQSNTVFDTARVFDLIPRRRITGIEPGRLPGSLMVAVAPGTFAKAFEANSAIVIDVAEGRAPEGSPAEAPIDPLRAESATGGASGGRILPFYRADRPPATDPWIDTIWAAGAAARSRAAQRSEAPAEAAPDTAALRATEEALVRQLARAASQGLVSTRAEDDIAALARRTEKATAEAAIGRLDGNEPPVAGPDATGHDTGNGMTDASADRPAEGEHEGSEAAQSLPLPSPQESPLSEAATDTPASRLPDASDAGNETVAAAAEAPAAKPSQQTVGTGSPVAGDGGARKDAEGTAVAGGQDSPASGHGGPVRAPHDPSAEPSTGREAADAGAGTDATARALAAAAAHIGIRARTSEDRDRIRTPEAPPETVDGNACPDAEDLDVAAWSGEGAPDLQIASARTAMVGEFDKPDEAAVVKLARLYLSFGLGAEAHDVLDAFAVPDAAAPWLRAMAEIMEDRIPADPAMAGLVACPGPVAIWGSLAMPPGDRRSWEAGRVLRALSGLPPRLRTLLAPAVAERFLAKGDTANARAAMDTIARLPEAPGPAASLMRARIGLAEQKVVPAMKEISNVIASNDPAAPAAVVLAIQSRLSRGQAVDPALADTAAALAFEHRAEPIGADLATAHVAAVAAAGKFAEAFSALATHRTDSPGADFAPAVRQIFQLLAELAPDGQLVATYDAEREQLRAAGPDPELRRALAARLANLGFSHETASLLSAGGVGGPSALSTEVDRLTLARAALGDMRPDRAIDALAGIGGPAAADMRDRAIVMAGSAPQPQARSVAAEVAPSAETAGTAPPSGPLARGKALVDQSRALRERLDSVLAADAAGTGGSGSTGGRGSTGGQTGTGKQSATGG